MPDPINGPFTLPISYRHGLNEWLKPPPPPSTDTDTAPTNPATGASGSSGGKRRGGKRGGGLGLISGGGPGVGAPPPLPPPVPLVPEAMWVFAESSYVDFLDDTWNVHLTLVGGVI